MVRKLLAELLHPLASAARGGNWPPRWQLAFDGRDARGSFDGRWWWTVLRSLAKWRGDWYFSYMRGIKDNVFPQDCLFWDIGWKRHEAVFRQIALAISGSYFSKERKSVPPFAHRCCWEGVLLCRTLRVVFHFLELTIRTFELAPIPKRATLSSCNPTFFHVQSCSFSGRIPIHHPQKH